MKKLLYIIFLSVYCNCIGQDLMQPILKDDQIIINSKAFEIKSTFNRIDPLDLEEPLDKEIYEDLKLQLKKEGESTWKQSDFENRILVFINQSIDIAAVKIILKNLNKEESKKIIREYRRYNSDPEFYRNFPLSISKPVYSTDGQYVVIGYSRGNNGGEIVLYRRVDNSWKYANLLARWAY